MLDYKVGFEIRLTDIYLIIQDSKGTIVFYEKVTDEVLPITQEYLKLIK